MKFHTATSRFNAATWAQWAAAAVVALLAAEAARQAEWYWLGLVAVASVVLAIRIARLSGSAGRPLTAGLALVGIAAAVAGVLTGHTAWHARALQGEAVRDATLDRNQLLQAAIADAQRTAVQALDRVGKIPATENPSISDLISSHGLETAIAVVAGDTVVAVAGPHRMQPIARSTPAALVSTPFARMLVVRANRAGRQAQVILLLDSLPGLPIAGPSLVSAAGHWEGVHWTWKPGLTRTIEFNSVAAATAGVIDGMQAVAPPVGAFTRREAQLARIIVAIGLLLFGVTSFFTAPAATVRAGALVVTLIALLRVDAASTVLQPVVMQTVSVAAVLLLLGIAFWRRPPLRTFLGITVAVVLLASAPLLALLLAGQVVPHFVPLTLASGFAWEVLVAIAAGGFLAVSTTPLRSRDDITAPSWWGLAATGASLVVGIVGVEAWHPIAMHSGAFWSTWSAWYLPLWIVPIALMIPVTPPRIRLVALATMASVFAALATWSTSLDRRMELAHADLDRLTASTDTAAIGALDSFAVTVRQAHATTLDRLYAAWSGSPLAREGVPTYLALWSAAGRQRDAVALDSLSIGWDELSPMVQSAGVEARRFGLSRRVGHHEVLILPLAPDTIATVVIGPRTRLLVPTTFGLLVGWRAPPVDPPYALDTLAVPPGAVPPDGEFRRDQRFLIADRVVSGGDVGDVAHVVRATVDMPTPQPFVIRAALAVLLDSLVIIGLWMLLQQWLGNPSQLPAGVFRRSYRRTLATTLMAFFIVPAILLTLSSVVRLRSDSQQQHAAEMAGVYSDVALNGGLDAADLALPARDSATRAHLEDLADSLATISENVNAAIGVYRNNRLFAASDSLLAKLGLVPPVFDRTLRAAGDADTNTLRSSLVRANLRLGRMATPVDGTTLLVAVPGGQTTLAREGVDQALRLALVALLGVIASLLVAGVIARRLGQPIDMLRRTAVAIGRREPPPATGNLPSEFVPVFRAINQMEEDLIASESELRADRSRTAAILATVATGVVGMNAAGEVTHANPRAAELLGHSIHVGQPLTAQLPDLWKTLGQGAERFAATAGEVPESREVAVGDRLFATTLAPLADGGLVLAITDITEASRAARIVAWGEMARQVAHEIKNPLTPMRLGLQHLRRVRADNAPGFPQLVDETAERLLVEIERLDRIARSFARYGAAPEAATALQPVDLGSAVAEVVSLIVLGPEHLEIVVTGTPAGTVRSRPEELAQVLLNLLDNSRQAGATRVDVELSGLALTLSDNGRGIPSDQLARIFEPSFSTNTSGTGLGLAIVRRLVEGWEATIGVTSVPGKGATFTVRFQSGAGEGTGQVQPGNV